MATYLQERAFVQQRDGVLHLNLDHLHTGKPTVSFLSLIRLVHVHAVHKGPHLDEMSCDEQPQSLA